MQDVKVQSIMWQDVCDTIIHHACQVSQHVFCHAHVLFSGALYKFGKLGEGESQIQVCLFHQKG